MFTRLSKLLTALSIALLLLFTPLFIPAAQAASPSNWRLCPSTSHTGGSMTTLTQKSFTLVCPGVNIGDWVEVSAPTDLLLLTVSAYVSAANTITIVIVNGSAGSITDPTTVYYVAVLPRYVSP